MATRYRIQIGDEIIEFEGPDDLSDAQISQLGDQYLKTAKPGQEFPPSVYIGDVVDPALAPPELEGDSSVLGSYARGVTQGGTANFSDEISAFANAAIPGLAALDNLTGMSGGEQQAFYDNPEGFWAAVRANMGDFSGQKEVDLAQHPTAHMLGEISGAVGTVPAASAAAARLPLALTEAAAARPILTATGLGGVGGAVSGAGAGTEGTRGQSAALGGLGGLAIGGSIAGTLELAPAIANYARIFFGRGNDKEAVRQITKALQRDGFDMTRPSMVQQLKDTLQQFTGKPVSLADIGGATRSRAGVGLRTPSAAQQQAIETLNNRTSGQGLRLAEDVRANVAPRTDVHAIDEALVAQRAQEAERLRELALYEDAPSNALPSQEFSQKQMENAIRKYIGDWHSDDLAAEFNSAIRAGNPNATQRKLRDRLSAFMTTLPEHEAKTVYRGLTVTPSQMKSLERGEDFLKPQFNSASSSPELASTSGESHFIPDINEAVMFNMRVPEGRYAADVTRHVPEEWQNDTIEYLLGPGKFTNVKEGDRFGKTQYSEGYRVFEGDFVPEYNVAPGRQSRVIDPTRETDPERYQTAVELQNLARLPDAQKALSGALKVTEAERARLAATGQSIDHLPDLSRGSNLDVRAFDALKRYLDDEITRIYKRGEGDSFKMADVANVRALRDDIRDRLKKFVPEYEDYLDQYAGSSEMIDSLREGVDYSKLSPEQISAAQSRRSKAGQELYRVGAARDMVDDLLSRERGFAADRISLADEARAQRLALGIDPNDADALNRSVEQERILNLLPKELQGAQTAQRAISQADANAGIDMTVPFNPGSPVGWAGMVARGIRDRVSLARNEAVNQELLPRLMETDPKIIGGIIDELEASGQAQLAAELRRRQAQSRAGLLGGLTIGAPVAIGE